MHGFEKPYLRRLDPTPPAILCVRSYPAKRRISLHEFHSICCDAAGLDFSVRNDRRGDDAVGPVLKSYVDYSHQPFIVIGRKLQREIETVAASLVPHQSRLIPKLLKRFECFLQITGHSDQIGSSNRDAFVRAAIDFIGALNSRYFMQGGKNVRGAATTAWLALLDLLQHTNPRIAIPEEVTRFHRSENGIKPLVKRFEESSFLILPLQTWCGWPTTNLRGKRYNVPLRNIANRLGMAVAARFYEAAHLYYSNRRTSRVPCLRQLDRFIGSYPGNLTVRLLRMPSFVRHFWQKFYEYYVDPSTNPESSVGTVTAEWRNAFPTFVSGYLEPSGLFARHPDVFPMPDPVSISGRARKVKKSIDGWVKSNLLTLVPLHVTDSKAIEILFGQIEQDIATVTSWAEQAAKDLWDRTQRRLRLAPLGRVVPYKSRSSPDPNVNTPRHYLVDRRNPDALQNMCAAFAHYGYLTADDLPLHLVYPRPLQQAAHDLGIPTALSLLPYCVLLTRHHPRITASFLEDLELYDDNGNLKCLQETEGDSSSPDLKGYKLRRGPELAEIEVFLNKQTYELVMQLIEVTDPLRTYLRKRGDSNWRFLLLSAGQSFGYPRRPGELADITSNPLRKAKIVDQIRANSDLPIRRVRTLVDQLSIPTVRNSAGTLIYLETHSEAEVGRAMGHAPSSRDLMDHYLPDPLRRFFKERFIRVFQTAILAEAMKGSRHFLDATGFATLQEAQEFLRNHALQPIQNDDQTTALTKERTGGHLAFGVNDEILTALFTLRAHVKAEKEPIAAEARYWARMADGLEANISKQSNRPDLQGCMRRAYSTRS